MVEGLNPFSVIGATFELTELDGGRFDWSNSQVVVYAIDRVQHFDDCLSPFSIFEIDQLWGFIQHLQYLKDPRLEQIHSCVQREDLLELD